MQMSISSKIPEIAVLRHHVELEYGGRLTVHSDFVLLRDAIFEKTKEHLSETTLERLWEYSTRGYDTVSRRTLDVVCSFIGHQNWDGFLRFLKEKGGSESDMFDSESVFTGQLTPGARLKIGWCPDRVCIIRYLGNDRFVAEETANSKLQVGDTFTCPHFQLHAPLLLDRLVDANGVSLGARYGVALKHGLTMLQLL